MNQKGIIFEIERYAVNDGPGIRTLIFLKGCPLRCWWCSNPESQNLHPELVYWPKKCIGCLECLEACPEQALTGTENGIAIDRTRCTGCGKCTEVCNAEALDLFGREVSVSEVIREVLKDEHYYRKSGGGVTFSGGEPYVQQPFLLNLLEKSKEQGIHTAVETCGGVPWKLIEPTLPFIDLFLYDFKQMDPDEHRRVTGADNREILANCISLVEAGKHVRPRFPLIPGINDSEKNLGALADFLTKHLPACRIDLLPYHTLGRTKYQRLDVKYEMEDTTIPEKNEAAEVKMFFEKRGFSVVTGG